MTHKLNSHEYKLLHRAVTIFVEFNIVAKNIKLVYAG